MCEPFLEASPAKHGQMRFEGVFHRGTVLRVARMKLWFVLSYQLIDDIVGDGRAESPLRAVPCFRWKWRSQCPQKSPANVEADCRVICV
jgi:hypothetical protein